MYVLFGPSTWTGYPVRLPGQVAKEEGPDTNEDANEASGSHKTFVFICGLIENITRKPIWQWISRGIFLYWKAVIFQGPCFFWGGGGIGGGPLPEYFEEVPILEPLAKWIVRSFNIYLGLW